MKLTSARAQLSEPEDYYRELRSLKQVGGGFPAFEQLSEKIYGMLSQVDLNDSADISRIGEQIKQLLHQLSWMPYTFKAILNSKNHLPNHKLHPRLLRPKQGFLGHGDYRHHFFGKRSLFFFIRFYLRERVNIALKPF